MDRIREFIDDYLYQCLLGVGGVVIILVVIIGIMASGHQSTMPATMSSQTTSEVSGDQGSSVEKTASQASEESTAAPQASGSDQQVYVDVKGAVKHPGVYQVSGSMRVIDAIDLAGGFNRSADKKQVNLAQKLTDQQVVYIPIRGEIKGNRAISATPNQTPTQAATSSASPSGSQQSSSPASGSGKINLNSADKTKLQELNGIGEKKADQIIAYRHQHGQFKSIEELKDVPGFGDKTFDNLKSSICV